VTTGPTRFIDELADAGRGVAALIVGNRKAPDYFDFSTRGLVGSFIAFLAITGVNAVIPLMMAGGNAGGAVARSVLSLAILFALQLGFSAIVLNQLKRLDGLVPYLVADNWATFFITAGMTLLGLVGFDGELALIAVGILVIVVEINIARLIVTLSPLQIAMFLVAQMVGESIGLLQIGMVMPAPATPNVADLAAFQ
jgi:hypothetical protein